MSTMDSSVFLMRKLMSFNSLSLLKLIKKNWSKDLKIHIQIPQKTLSLAEDKRYKFDVKMLTFFLLDFGVSAATVSWKRGSYPAIKISQHHYVLSQTVRSSWSVVVIVITTGFERRLASFVYEIKGQKFTVYKVESEIDAFGYGYNPASFYTQQLTIH